MKRESDTIEFDPPSIPSCCVENDECYSQMKPAEELMTQSFTTLENNFSVYRKTMAAYEKMVALADAAAGLTPYAKYA